MHLDTRNPRLAFGVFATALVIAVATGRLDVSPVWDLVAAPGSHAGDNAHAASPAGEPYDEAFWGTAKPSRPEVGVPRQGVDPTVVPTVDNAKRDATEHPKGLSVAEIVRTVSTPLVAGELAAGSGEPTVDAETPTTLVAAGGEVAPPKPEPTVAATRTQHEPDADTDGAAPRPQKPATTPDKPATKPDR